MAIIGELTCLLTALTVAPALLALLRPRSVPVTGAGQGRAATRA
jgi:hypothetical protein